MNFKNTKSYSQYNEDLLLKSIFNNKSGICVEVGANDGITLSNTLFFEKLGWKCILVEPDPDLYKLIQLNRKHSTAFNIAASDRKIKNIDFYIPEYNNLYSSLEKRSTMSDIISQNKVPVKKIKVNCDKLDTILRAAGINSIDFIVIDVEGHELSVLKGLSLSLWRPLILIIEDSTDISLARNKSKIYRHMKRNNYLNFYRSGGNDWYIERKNFNFLFLIKLILHFDLKGLAIANLPFFIKNLIINTIRFMRYKCPRFF